MKTFPCTFAFACVCALLPLSFALPAEAARQLSAEQKEALQERLRSADRNEDGFIDREEAEAGLPRIAERFDQLDADRDGRLSREELKAIATKFAQRRRR